MAASTISVGQQGEQAARHFLEQRGYKFLAANWRCKLGEVDLIMQDGDTRVMVEVRTRRPTTFGEGADTVAWQKKGKLIRAAKFYQQKENYWGDLRFDVVSILLDTDPSLQIEHITDAFSS